MEKNSKIYIAGHSGMVGSALIRKLQLLGYKNIILREFNELDLRNQSQTENFIKAERPHYIFLAAAKVGGIHANSSYPAEFIYDNLMIEANVIHAAYKYGVQKLLFLGSSCIYPKFAPQPIKEEYLLTDVLEPSNEPYAIAKIAGIELCKFYRRQYGSNFISVMPTNLYGINDNFDLNTSHVLPALIRKFHEAKVSSDKEVVIWGSGKPRRELLFVDDLADALLFLMENYNEETHINVGTGEDIEINELAKLIQRIIGFKSEIKNDFSKPDGTPKKLLDVSRLHALGWKHHTSLREGIIKVYEWYSMKMESDKNK